LCATAATKKKQVVLSRMVGADELPSGTQVSPSKTQVCVRRGVRPSSVALFA
jgi:hypothetical protein